MRLRYVAQQWVYAVYPLTQSNKTDAMRSWINTKPNLNPILNHHVAIISADGCSSDMFIANPGVLRRPRSHIVEDEVVGHTLYNFHSADPTG